MDRATAPSASLTYHFHRFIIITEFISGYIKKDAQNLFSMTKIRLPRRHKCLLAMTILGLLKDVAS
ncbi:hypothetical protein [Rickettsia endosymbiont of Orchestes rusci]|uniref:hypothetical protein n=1 Tax=Rickettsia endosymbiont of Orchestes rusci TaxID=3066250 RepID=UPI00313D35D6